MVITDAWEAINEKFRYQIRKTNSLPSFDELKKYMEYLHNELMINVDIDTPLVNSVLRLLKEEFRACLKTERYHNKIRR